VNHANGSQDTPVWDLNTRFHSLVNEALRIELRRVGLYSEMVPGVQRVFRMLVRVQNIIDDHVPRHPSSMSRQKLLKLWDQNITETQAVDVVLYSFSSWDFKLEIDKGRIL